MNGSTQRWRGSDFSFKNIMFKIFLKLLGVTRTRIRILGSGSVKKFIETENANDSCSTTGKPTRSFATERVSLDSV